MLKYLFALVLLLPSAAFAQSPPPGDGSPTDPSRGCQYWYPPDLQRAGITGTTLVSFHILVSGFVDSPAVVETSGNADLDNAALQCVARWKYKPATLHGEPVEVTQKVKIVWQLPEADPASPTAPPN